MKIKKCAIFPRNKVNIWNTKKDEGVLSDIGEETQLVKIASQKTSHIIF